MGAHAAQVQADQAQASGSAPTAAAPQANLPYSIEHAQAPMYPGLADFMGLELTDDVLRLNMPEYLNTNAVAIQQVRNKMVF